MPPRVAEERRGFRVLEAFQDERAFGGVLAIGEDAVAVEPGEHVHLLEHVEQRGHRPPSQVGL
jgi:hypothetical protein